MTAWQALPKRKPMLIQGARQVGKTWILRRFGESRFENCILLDFAENKALNGFFRPDLKPERILTDLGLYLDTDITLEDTLLIFDEVQLCPEALTSLKYFYERYPEAYICASGSLLGIGLSEQNFPVGKVQREWLQPMSFFEFVDALGMEPFRRALQSTGRDRIPLSQPIHEKAFGLFREYLACGGLPEVVRTYIGLRDTRVAAFRAARSLQNELVKSYMDDIAKHSGKLKAMRIAGVFNNIPEQLARETTGIRKFIFKDVLPGKSSYDELEAPIEWLSQAGLIHRVPICRTIQQPLAAYTAKNAFMLYLFDVGILGAMLDLDSSVLYRYDLGQFKGFLAENAVLNEMKCGGITPVYTWREGTSEIEFIVPREDKAIPVEVKAGLNTKAKSMGVFRRKYSPELAVLLSAQGANQQDDGLLHAPLYLASCL
ncbi:MAG: ATP-binding protein [Lentisphaerae bacterium]|nr:ATP-binding protein [Lentisphaerota bacterium]